MSHCIRSIHPTSAVFKVPLPTFNPRMPQLEFRIPYVSMRSYAESSKPNFCPCGALIPESNRIVTLFKERSLKKLIKEVECSSLKRFRFVRPKDCELANSIQVVANLGLRKFPDVIHMGDHLVLLEGLKEKPKKEVGDLTGDYGIPLAKFLQDCLVREVFKDDIGSLIDVGGQNTSTVDLVLNVLGKQKNLPSLIIDVNSVTPAVAKEKPHIKYVLDKAINFFLSENYHDLVGQVLNEKPSLMIFNNLLNVLTAKDGWNTLQVAWNRLRSGDYLVISGLVPEQLEKQHGIKILQVDGIVEFHSFDGFYKSALSANFLEHLQHKLQTVKILYEETFKFVLESNPPHLINVKGRRLLTLKKM